MISSSRSQTQLWPSFPAPEFEVKVFDFEGGAKVAVIRVEPAAEPPCLTHDGRVFVRVTGETVPATDPAVLARLTDQGRAARERAEHRVVEVVERMLQERVIDATAPRNLTVAIAITASAAIEDRKPFSEDFQDALDETVGNLPPAPLFPALGPAHLGDHEVLRGTERTVGQTFVRYDARNERQRWRVTVLADGSIGIALDVDGHAENEGRFTVDYLFDEVARPALRAAREIASALGAYGPVEVAIRLAGNVLLRTNDGLDHELTPLGHARGRVDDLGDPEHAIARFKRDILRGLGLPAWEP